MIVNLFFLIAFSLLMAPAVNLVLKSVKKISEITGIGSYVLAGLITALGTSLPEVFIAIQAALKKQSELAVGNVVGSNLADLSVIIGGATLIGGQLKITKNILKEDVYYAFLISSAPLMFLIDKQLTRFEGLILILLYGYWQFVSLKKNRPASQGKILKEKVSKIQNGNNLFFLGGKFLTGIILLLFSAQQLVKNSFQLAEQFKIPAILVGIFITGLGSSLPELAVQTKAIKNKEASIALGDLLGSIIANASLILGVVALIYPIQITQPKIYFSSTLFLLITFAIFYVFIKTKSSLEKWEGAILLMFYLLLAAIELV